MYLRKNTKSCHLYYGIKKIIYFFRTKFGIKIRKKTTERDIIKRKTHGKEIKPLLQVLDTRFWTTEPCRKQPHMELDHNLRSQNPVHYHYTIRLEALWQGFEP